MTDDVEPWAVANRRVVANQDHVGTQLREEMVLLQLQTGKYFRLDPVGTFIWRWLDEPRTMGFLRDAVLKRYDVDAGRCQRDLERLVEALRHAGFVELRE